ncbi:hypothetical protein A2U01_0091256, partial [Trifolium medium]|nr:hypothetical protein [Trifolium medium]
PKRRMVDAAVHPERACKLIWASGGSSVMVGGGSKSKGLGERSMRSGCDSGGSSVMSMKNRPLHLC